MISRLPSFTCRPTFLPDWAIKAESILVGLILVVFVCTGIAYSLVVPPFETPDEIYHYAFARHLAAGNGLPVQGPEMTGPWEQEGSQPPLYYSLVALVTAGIDQSGLDEFAVRNPRANLGDPHQPGNKNYMLFSSQSRPLNGVNLALHIGRWVSVILGTLTVFFTYLLTRFVFPSDRWSRLLATALVATIPQFNFISASVSNDIMITVVSAAALVWLAAKCGRAWFEGIRWWEWIGFGLLLGLGALSKLQGLGLLPLAAFAFLMRFGRHKDWHFLINGALLVGSMILIVAGWWYARNLFLYGDAFGTRNLLSVTGQRVDPLSFQGLYGELRGLQMSFWGIFGWFSILLPSWIYSLFELLTALAASGAIITWIRSLKASGGSNALMEQLRSPLGIAWIWVLTSLALMGYWISVAQGSQGRLLFPAISALAVVAIPGLRFWAGFLPRIGRIGLGIIVPLGLWSCSLFALVDLLPATYGLKIESRAVAVVPEDARPIDKTYGEGLELVAAQLPERRFLAGENVPVTLYMRTRQIQTQDHQLFLQLLDEKNKQIGNITTHPGWGVRPLTLWQPGVLYADEYQITLSDFLDLRSPLLARLYVGFTNSEDVGARRGDLVPVIGGDSTIESRIIGSVEIGISEPARLRPTELSSTEIYFENVIGLTGYHFPLELYSGTDRVLPAVLFWEAIGSPVEELTAFVHFVGPDGDLVTGYDGPLAEGRFPTSRWLEGDASLSSFPLALPSDLQAGDYQVWVGLYRAYSAGLERLPVIADNRTVRDNRVLLSSVKVRRE